MKIHISGSTYNSLRDCGGYQTESRGPIEIKGKGVMTTHWLLCRKDTPTNNTIINSSEKQTSPVQNQAKITKDEDPKIKDRKIVMAWGEGQDSVVER